MSPSEFDLRAQVACARRELGKRKHYYPYLIQKKKLTRDEAEKETACMEAILVTLTNLMIDHDKRNNPTLFDRIAPQ